MDSPTKRTLALYRSDGWTAAITEHWNSFAKIRQDLFGFIDILAIKPGFTGSLAIQTTSSANMSARYHKITSTVTAKLWLECGNQLVIVGWAKRGARGERKLWTASIKKVTLEDFTQEKTDEAQTAIQSGAGVDVRDGGLCEQGHQPGSG